MNNHRKLNNEQLTRMIALHDRQIALMETELRRHGMTDTELQASRDRAEAAHQQQEASGTWTVKLGSNDYQFDSALPNGNITITPVNNPGGRDTHWKL